MWHAPGEVSTETVGRMRDLTWATDCTLSLATYTNGCRAVDECREACMNWLTSGGLSLDSMLLGVFPDQRLQKTSKRSQMASLPYCC